MNKDVQMERMGKSVVRHVTVPGITLPVILSVDNVYVNQDTEENIVPEVVKKDILGLTVIRFVSVKMMLFVISLLEHAHVKMDTLAQPAMSHVLLGGTVQTVV